MNVAIEQRPEDLTVRGYFVRTRPESAASDIPALWTKFMQSGLASRGGIYAVYCDYESDDRGAYTLIVGVDAPEVELADGMRSVTVPSGRYAKVMVEGAPAQVVWKGWSFINTEWSDKKRRLYRADFERYLPGAAVGAVRAELCVGID